MKSPPVLFAGILALSLPAAAFAGPPAYAPRYHAETVRVAPPPPRVEVIGPPPAIGYIWIDGYWLWAGARYVWVPGRWEAPRTGYHWKPHHRDRSGHHWHRHGGHWTPGPGYYR